jgi:hypothetical protein
VAAGKTSMFRGSRIIEKIIGYLPSLVRRPVDGCCRVHKLTNSGLRIDDAYFERFEAGVFYVSAS